MRLTAFSLAVVLMACGGGSESEAPASEGDVAIAVSALSSVHRGTNTFSLKTASDATTVEVVAWMPSMGHGAPNDPRVIKEQNGSYCVEDVTFSMPGTWELKVNVSCPVRSGSQTFRFDVP